MSFLDYSFKILVSIFLLFLVSFTGFAQVTSSASGDWNVSTTWNGGIIPGAVNNVVINHSVTIPPGTTAEAYTLTIGSTGKLYVYGTLILHGDLVMVNNNPELITGSGASIYIYGSAILANKVDVTLSSYFVVLNNFTISGGGNTSITINNASLYVFGTFDAGSTGLTLCDDYDNLTVDKSELCDVGTETAFEENVDDGIIPEEISDIVYQCTSPSITNPGAQTACSSYSLPTITGTNLSGNQAYYNNSQALGGTQITGPITSSQTVWIFDQTAEGCSDEQSFAVTIVSPPSINNPGAQTACSSYSLPTITGTNLSGNQAYYNNSHALGGTQITGTITSSQTVWIYDQTATGCSDEESFLVTVFDVPTLAATSTNPDVCGENGIIEFTFTHVPDGNFSIYYNNGNFSNVTVSSGTATVSVPPGNYNNLYISVNGCLSTEDVDITITNVDAPNVSNLTALYVADQDVCPGESSDIQVNSTSLIDGVYTVTYDLSAPNTATGETSTFSLISGSGTFSTIPLTNMGVTVLTIKSIEENGCFSSTSVNVNIPVDTTAPTITCPDDVTVQTDAGECVATGITLENPVTGDNCGVASVNNNGTGTYSLGTTTIIWTVTDNSGNTATCNQNITVNPFEVIDVEVVDLGDDCQSGETGTKTTITWIVQKISGTSNWSFDYTINKGATNVATGTGISASGSSKEVSFEFDNSTAVSQSFSISISNVTDACGLNETNTANNNDSVTLHGVPDTSDITSN